MSNVTREAIPRPLKVSAAPKQEICKMKRKLKRKLILSDRSYSHQKSQSKHFLLLFDRFDLYSAGYKCL